VPTGLSSSGRVCCTCRGRGSARVWRGGVECVRRWAGGGRGGRRWVCLLAATAGAWGGGLAGPRGRRRWGGCVGCGARDVGAVAPAAAARRAVEQSRPRLRRWLLPLLGALCRGQNERAFYWLADARGGGGGATALVGAQASGRRHVDSTLFLRARDVMRLLSHLIMEILCVLDHINCIFHGHKEELK